MKGFLGRGRFELPKTSVIRNYAGADYLWPDLDISPGCNVTSIQKCLALQGIRTPSFATLRHRCFFSEVTTTRPRLG